MSEGRTGYDSGWDGPRVQELRLRFRDSQTGFARRMGVRQQTVSEWETGRYRPRGASARLLSLLAEEAAHYEAGAPAAPVEGASGAESP